MQSPERFSDLPEYAFPRLRALLAEIPAGGPEIAMSLGEPRHGSPPFVTEIIARHADGFGRYPPNDGLPDLRLAISEWLGRRYDLPEAWRDPDTRIFPLNGTREGLFAACVALSPETRNGERAAVLMPNPFYPCYSVAALTAGAEPIYAPATAETGFLPDFEAAPEDILRRTTVCYMCSPSNPQGAVASKEWWTRLIRLAEKHDFRIFADECYSEIYRDGAPTGALAAARDAGADPERVLVFHSLSKRSSLPGLRSGFCAGGPQAIAAMKRLRSYVGAPLPEPIQHASAACWRDEDHVVRNRALYREKFEIADRVLDGMPGYRSPAAGFFLWLDVIDGEAAARRLWREAGVKVLPGSYLSRRSGPRLGDVDPGFQYIRVALVADAGSVERGLKLLRSALVDWRA